MVVVRKKRKQTKEDLLAAITRFALLLEGQKEQEAAQDLRAAAEKLSTSEEGSEDFLSALTAIYDSFEGEHELKAYTLATVKPEEAWTETEELYHASVQVYNLVKRLRSVFS